MFLIGNQFRQFDASLQSTLSKNLWSPVNEHAWTLAILPPRLGGLGLGNILRSASVSLASISHTKQIASHLLDNLLPTSGSPTPLLGELPCKIIHENQTGTENINLRQMSQRTIQAKLDELEFECLYDESNMYGCSNHTIAWLIPDLSLAIPSLKFVVAVKIWLGLPCFTGVPCVIMEQFTCLVVVTTYTKSKV